MDILTSKMHLLSKHLLSENIIDIDILSVSETLTFQETVQFLRQKLLETYPQTKLKRMMKSIHYANAFLDENLKQSAFLLDEIEQYLSINKFLDHNITVGYFNDKIISDGMSVTPSCLVETMIESLLLSRGKK